MIFVCFWLDNVFLICLTQDLKYIHLDKPENVSVADPAPTNSRAPLKRPRDAVLAGQSSGLGPG